MEVMKGLLESRKAIFSIMLIIAGSVLAVLKIMTVEQWVEYTKWLGGFYVASEAVDSGLGKLSGIVGKKAATEQAKEEPKLTKMTDKFKKAKKNAAE